MTNQDKEIDDKVERSLEMLRALDAFHPSDDQLPKFRSMGPTVLPQIDVDRIPTELKNERRWICWSYGERDGKNTKIPKLWNDPTNNAKSNDPTTWTTFERALSRFHDGVVTGIGFMLGDGWCGVDLDDCLDEHKAVTNWSAPIIDKLRNTYGEISPSGTGVKFIMRAKKPEGKCKKNLATGAVEIYDKGRFFTVTSRRLSGVSFVTSTMQSEVDALHRELFPSPADASDASDAWENVATTDDEIIARIKANDRESRLWAGDISAYANDHSDADLALVGYICSQTTDRAQVDRIFRLSGLMRDKWNRQDYRDWTIDKGMKGKTTTAGAVVVYETSDIGNARMFCDEFGKNFRYVAEWKCWLAWNGKVWERDILRKHRRSAIDCARHTMLRYAAAIKDDDRRSKYLKWAGASQNVKRIDAMISLAKDSTALSISTAALDRNGNLFNLQNGTLDLETFKLRPHDPGDLLTKISPCCFNESATHPLFSKFLERIFQNADDITDHELIGYVCKAMGLTLTTDVSAECIFLLHGNGQNGKSTLVRQIEIVLGDYAVVASQDILTAKDARFKGSNSDDIADLFGKRLAIISETAEDQRVDDARLKLLASTDRLKAMRKYETGFEFEPTHKLWLHCNHLPKTKATDRGFWRRVKRIPFLVTIPESERDPELKDKKLPAERDGILNFMIAGLKAYRMEGLTEPAAVRNATNEYRQDSDLLGRFLMDCCEQNPAGEVSPSELYTAYKGWCERQGIKQVITQIELGKQLQGKGYDRRRTASERMWQGLTLLTPCEAESPWSDVK